MLLLLLSDRDQFVVVLRLQLLLLFERVHELHLLDALLNHLLISSLDGIRVVDTLLVLVIIVLIELLGTARNHRMHG